MKLTIFASLLTFILLFTSCINSANKKSESDKLTIGVMSSMDYLPLAVAQKNGYFAENGLEVSIQKFYSANERDAALQSGNLDGTILDYTGGAIQVYGGIPIRFVSQCDATFELVAGKKSDVTNLSELRNKKIAISRNTVIDFCTNLALLKAGLTQKDTEMVEINKIPLRLEMLNNAKIDATMLPDPFASIAKNDGNTLIFNMSELDIRITGIAFLQKTIDEKSEALNKFYKAYNQAIDALQSKKVEDFKSLLTTEIGFPSELISEIKLPFYSQAQSPRKSDLEEVEKWLKERNLIDQDFDIQTIVATGIIQ